MAVALQLLYIFYNFYWVFRAATYYWA